MYGERDDFLSLKSCMMNREKMTDRISLAYAMECVLLGLEITTDATKPTRQFSFPEYDDVFEPFIRALMDGELKAKGRLAVLDLDFPVLEIDTSDVHVKQACMHWRHKGDITLAAGLEGSAKNVPAESWWYDGIIWEQSTLWTQDPDAYQERCDVLKIERRVPYYPERPYGFERAVCFEFITVPVVELRDWVRTLRSTERQKSPNPRNAGPKAKEDWRKVETIIEEAISDGQTWVSWDDLWYFLRDHLSFPDSAKNSPQPYKKLEKRLRTHNPDLLAAVRRAIAKV